MHEADENGNFIAFEVYGEDLALLRKGVKQPQMSWESVAALGARMLRAIRSVHDAGCALTR